MLSTIKKIVVIFFLSVFLIFASLVLYVYFNEEKIISYVIGSLNEKIDTKISSSKVDVSLLKNFPNVSLSFQNLTIESSRKYQEKHPGKNQLLTANKLHIHFNLYHFLHKNFILSGISIEEGNINILIDKKGEHNFQFWKDEESKTEENIAFALKKIVLKKMRVQYIDLSRNINASSFFETISVAGSMGIDNSEARVTIKGSQLKTNQNFLKSLGKEFELKTDVDYAQNKLNFENLSFTYGNISLLADYQQNNSEIVIQYQLNPAKIIDINELAYSFLPKDLELINGSIAANGTISKSKNLWNQTSAVTLSDIKLNYRKNPIDNISGALEMKGIMHDIELSTKKLQLSYANSQIEVEAFYKNSTKEELAANIKAELDLKVLNSFIDNKLLLFEDGVTQLSLSIKNRNDFSKKEKFNWSDFIINGEMELSKLNVTTNNLHIKNFSSHIRFSDNDVKLRNTKGNLNTASFEAVLDIYHLFPFLDSEANLSVLGTVKCDSILPAQFISSQTDTGSNSELSSTPSVSGKIELESKHFVYGKIHFRDIYTHLNFANNSYAFSQLKAKFCQGSIEASSISIANNKDILVQSDITFKNLDIRELFKIFDNFNQHQIVAENLQGSLSGSCQSSLIWNENMVFNTKALKGSANFEIQNGTLSNFKPVQKLSQFLEIDDINNIKFRTIKNTISIRDQILFIPEMSIQSTAVNLNISGQHSFMNEYEYHFNMLLTDLLLPKRKNKKADQEFGKVEEDNQNKTRIYVKMTGKEDKYKIAYDNRKAMEVFSGKMVIEKKQLKSILAEEFKLVKRDTSENIVNKKKIVIENDELIRPKESSDSKSSVKKTATIEWKDE